MVNICMKGEVVESLVPVGCFVNLLTVLCGKLTSSFTGMLGEHESCRVSRSCKLTGAHVYSVVFNWMPKKGPGEVLIML